MVDGVAGGPGHGVTWLDGREPIGRGPFMTLCGYRGPIFRPIAGAECDLSACCIE